MTGKFGALHKRIDVITGSIGLLILLDTWLIVATLPDFYFISPSRVRHFWGQFEIGLSMMGIIALSTIAPLILIAHALGFKKAINWLPIATLLWPTSVVLKQVDALLTDGVLYLASLLRHPVFIYIDFVLPIFLMITWQNLRKKQ